MGKNSKARRDAKAKQRAKRRADHESKSRAQPADQPFASPFGNPFAQPTRPVDGPEARWRLMEQAARDNDPDLPKLAERMVRDDPVRGDRVAETILLSYLDTLWRAGWQPRELVRQTRRRASAASAQVVELAIIADHERRSGQALDPRWVAQLDELGGRTISTRGSWLHAWRQRHGHDEVWAAIAVAKAIAAIGYLPVLETLIPPPGQPGAVKGIPLTEPVDDPVLGRIRKLLSKAESTEFEEEAEALTAKAHALMTKHAIDQALLHPHEPSDVPRTIRIPVDAPYADAKSLLLQVVAESQRCRSIFHSGIELSSIVGHVGDLHAVEMLFTSLLVQAQHALSATAGGAGSRGRRQSYRSAFYIAYASRIGERLRTVTDEVIADGDSQSTLPVLAARMDAVDEAFNDQFTQVVQSQVRGGWDALGSMHGRDAADKAQFGSGAIAT